MLSEEESIISAAKQGNIGAFKKIFDFYMPRMRPVCLRYAQCAFDADDILQEAFIKIHKNLYQFKFKGSFEGWIKRIVINTALNHYKKSNPSYVLHNIDEINEAEIGQAEITLLEESSTSAIFLALNKLPPGYKMVLTLYTLEDYAHKEIAHMLGITEGSSRSQYAKAKKMLINLLSRQRNEDKSDLLKKIKP
ncbi:RNA polymerase sigma factor [Cytophagaceae bacterium ABcell3]|nr:RNA polymerase sigma factor [Cytophagaceae bacterium ABcell3]